jgi:hypothetical protein
MMVDGGGVERPLWGASLTLAVSKRFALVLRFQFESE